ncbi:MAG: acetyl-CoA C-acyltransferase, partial [Candidatus Puniceispirillaceae bacterium]
MSATRTAIGGFGGSLKNKSPIDLGIAVTSEAIDRSGLATDEIDHGIYG